MGPTFDPEELAGRKVVALFDRAEARDFTDVYALTTRYPKDVLLARAADLDPGFTSAVFSEMLNTLKRFTDTELAV
ncbi:nucleotidyl transferase AbiEii/AbiGii toxin family protein [Amycolatopsis sp. NBC_00345]|uniref:nucleotidyl transferase AbiEii/AbiGii toxin family protein n=1 Tax=Amycolatopsis sp. NBC_00345 TaxID=2975955 RepID=UPI002E25BF92